MFPILFEIGPFSIHSLWFFVVLGLIAASANFARLVKRYRVKFPLLLENGVLLLVTTLVSSRIFYAIFHIYEFPNFLSIFRIWDRGLSFWGALAGFSGAILMLARKKGESPWRLFDFLVQPVLVGLLFGHIGTFLDGMAHGRATSLPWGITFQSAAVKYAVPVHPTQLYAFLYTLILFIFLSRRARVWLVKQDGFTAKMAIFGYSLFRFIEGFFRGDDTLALFNFIRIPEVIALAAFAGITYLLLKEDEKLFRGTLNDLKNSIKRPSA